MHQATQSEETNSLSDIRAEWEGKIDEALHEMDKLCNPEDHTAELFVESLQELYGDLSEETAKFKKEMAADLKTLGNEVLHFIGSKFF